MPDREWTLGCLSERQGRRRMLTILTPSLAGLGDSKQRKRPRSESAAAAAAAGGVVDRFQCCRLSQSHQAED